MQCLATVEIQVVICKDFPPKIEITMAPKAIVLKVPKEDGGMDTADGPG